MSDQDVVDGHGGHVGVLTVVGAGRDGGGLVGGVVDLRGHFGRDGDEADLHGRGQVTNGGHAQTGGLQGGVQLTVLDQLDRLGVRQELDLAHVLVAQTGGFEDGAGVELGAGLRRADGDALALEVFQGLDAGFGVGDDLDVVRVGAGDGAQLLQRRLEAGVFHAVPGIGHRVAQGEGQFAATGLQQVEVLHRCLGRLYRGLGAVDAVAVQLRQGHADRVVHAAGATGKHVDEGWGSEHRSAGSDGRSRGEQADFLGQSHGSISVVVMALCRVSLDAPRRRRRRAISSAGCSVGQEPRRTR